jgi:hypothetical protein
METESERRQDMRKTVWLVVVFVLHCAVAWAETGAGIGHVQTLRGSASILRGTEVVVVAAGMAIQRQDVIRTAPDSAVGIVLLDDTTISLGADSELVLAECTFEPKEGRLGLVMRMIKGTFSYVSGMIGKLAPDSVRLEIPDGTIAVRGTKLLVEARP